MMWAVSSLVLTTVSYFLTEHPVDHTAIPTLKQVIEYVKQLSGQQVSFQIEIKTDPEHPDHTFSPRILAQAVAKILKEEGVVGHAVVQAFDYRCLLELQKINPEITTVYLTAQENEPKMRSDDET